MSGGSSLVTSGQVAVVLSATTVIFLSLLFAQARKARTLVDLWVVPGAFLVNVLGWAVSVWLYVVYYNGAGDSIGTYFGRGVDLYHHFHGHPGSLFKLLLGILPPEELYTYNLPRRFLTDSGTWYTVKLSALTMTVVGTNFLYLGFVFTLFGFAGAYGVYRTLARDLPSIRHGRAFCFMYIPSFVLYGSGLMKEPICTFGAYLLFNFVYRLAQDNRFSFVALAGAIVGAHFLLSIKSYIFLAFAPGLLLWTVLRFYRKVENPILRVGLTPVMIVVVSVGLFYAQGIVAAKTQELALDQVTETIASQTEYWNENATSGSAYTLPDIEFTPAGLLKSLPSLYLTGAFRPYLWDSRSVIILLAAFESTALFVWVCFFMFRSGFGTFWRRVFGDPMLLCFFVYSFIFFPVVALTSGNFGTLIRYRLPALPFFLAMFVIGDYLASRARSARVSPASTADASGMGYLAPASS